MCKTPPHFAAPPLSARPRFQASAEKSPCKIGEFCGTQCDSADCVQNPSAPTALACKALRRATLALLLALTLQNPAPAQETAEKPAAANQLTAEQTAAGWVSLFDGKTLSGWKPTSNADWKVVDGEIRVSSGDAGWLMTNDEYTDYELHVEFKAPATTNSGVFLRTPLEPKDPTKDCAEINIAPADNPFPTASLVGRHRVDWKSSGRLMVDSLSAGMTTLDAAELPNPWDRGWHAFDVVVRGTIVHVWLDGVTPFAGAVSDYLSGPEDPTRGHIGLQFREGQVAFRNIRIKVLLAKKWEAE